MLVGGIVFHVIKNLNISVVVYQRFKPIVKNLKDKIATLKRGIFIKKVVDLIKHHREIRKIVKDDTEAVLFDLNSKVYQKTFVEVYTNISDLNVLVINYFRTLY